MKAAYRRILIKLSGAQLAGENGFALETKVKKSNSFRGWDTLLKRYAKQEARLAKGRGRINEKAGAKLWNEMIDIGDNAIVEMVRVTQFDRLYSVTEADGWLHMKRA